MAETMRTARMLAAVIIAMIEVPFQLRPAKVCQISLLCEV